MVISHHSTGRAGLLAITSACALLGGLVAPTARATDFTGLPSGGQKVVCVTGTGDIYVPNSSNECNTDAGDPSAIVRPDGFISGNAVFNDTANSTTFIGGTVQVNAPITISGPTGLNGTNTFGGSSTFNALADFNNGITSNTINNSGTVTTSTLSATTVSGGTIVGSSISATSSLYVSNGSTVDMGFNQIKSVGAGTVSASSTDAVNGSQLYAVQQTAVGSSAEIGGGAAAALGGGASFSGGTFTGPTYNVAGGSFSDVGSALDALDAVDFELERDIKRNRREARRGIAAATAIGDAPMPSAPGRTAYVANIAHYRGETAFGASIAHRFNTDAPFALTAGVSHAGKKDTIVKAGVAGEF